MTPTVSNDNEDIVEADHVPGSGKTSKRETPTCMDGRLCSGADIVLLLIIVNVFVHC